MVTYEGLFTPLKRRIDRLYLISCVLYMIGQHKRKRRRINKKAPSGAFSLSPLLHNAVVVKGCLVLSGLDVVILDPVPGQLQVDLRGIDAILGQRLSIIAA